MTNVSATKEKKATRTGLFAFAVETLEGEGWTVSRIPRGGKASLRKISKGGKSYKVSIRTSQDAWIAFPRKTKSAGWITLDEVDYVVAVSVDDRHNPSEARVHMMPADVVREHFDRAYDARKAAQHRLPEGRGIWISLYEKEALEPVTYVGAGLGLAYKPIGVLDLAKASLPAGDEQVRADDDEDDDPIAVEGDEAIAPLTIPEAKRRLAAFLGVPEEAIKITIEH